jgi:alkylation response protein AidB-like acyl-CoA dehydrogenase
MNLEPTDEQRELRATVRRFLETTAGGDAAVLSGLAAMGATGVLVPEEFGGSGLSLTDAVVVAEETGAALVCASWLSTAILAPRAIQRFGAEATAADVLTGIADGTVTATVALGDTHDDVDVVLVTETRPDGDALLCGGRLLGTAPHGTIAALVDDVFIATAADALGTAQRLLDSAVAYATTRTQFGHPIGSFQSVAHLCVDMFEIVELTRSGVVHAAWAADDADAGERHLAAWRLKAFAGRLATVGDTAIQVFGGIGFTWEHHAHRHLRRLLAWSSLLGGSDPYLEEVGDLFVASVVGSAHA